MSSVEPLLRRQWQVLRAWLESERVLERGDLPSGLGEWTVADLVVHLGYGLRMVADLTATDREPIPVTRYVAGYAPAHERIAADTTELAGSWRGRELEAVDELATEAWQALDRGLPEVVLGRRGPLRRDDFLVTRLLELVVHGDDLHREARPDRPSPVLPEAVAVVAAVVADGYAQVAGSAPAWTGVELLRLATGRSPTDDPHLPLLS